ncbi:hypothetical protein HYFRA_00007845 [Hymenoscyphus fraxineus]|uniref:Uncharacterized protein n=1 Tax=Hymenoscyphus fraxineus TaxID=746836 RepID=A0A9N9PPM8_9HELO|nr:hypothetical protein HYFRA_00007845 [Hymenoscyphus fraxineus]
MQLQPIIILATLAKTVYSLGWGYAECRIAGNPDSPTTQEACTAAKANNGCYDCNYVIGYQYFACKSNQRLIDPNGGWNQVCLNAGANSGTGQ